MTSKKLIVQTFPERTHRAMLVCHLDGQEIVRLTTRGLYLFYVVSKG